MSFTKEQAKSTSILSIASSLGIELKKVSSNIYEWTEHDSFKIYENTNSFSWFSQSIHGDAIALVQTIKEVSFRDAIKYIESGDLPEVAIDNSPKKPFQYYLASYEYDHIKQGKTFLGDTRGLSEDTITTFRSKGLLAQARLKGSDGIFEPVLVFKFLNKDKKSLAVVCKVFTKTTYDMNMVDLKRCFVMVLLVSILILVHLNDLYFLKLLLT